MTRPVHRVAPTTDTAIRQDGLRAHNLILTFQQIVGARQAPISRSELATGTGLTRPTISRIVDELLAAGLIVEAGPARSGSSGRPRVGLSLARTGPAGLGLDLRAGALSACVVDLAGAVRHLDFAAHAGREVPPGETLASLAAMAGKAVRAAAADGLTVVGTTFAAPGPVQDDSLVRFAPALGWRDVDAGATLSALTGSTVVVGNDAALATLGELYAGSAELRDFVCVSGEFDIGAGVVLAGGPLHGSRGHLGHVMVDGDGPPCACGATGCLQGYAGLREILAAAGADDPAVAPAVAIDALVSAGSPAILAALDRAATALGVAVSALLNLVEVDTVLLGGGYSLLASWLIEGVEREISQRVLSARWSPVQVRPAPLGPDAAVIGAALNSIDQVRRDPNRWLAHTRP
ncbi:ROK family transcriptional regulator [Actinoplanes regularis]|uniref:ROK family transcriptional regulator n=1 Tax=Actinoplanes regularis TaxID=52697 RepID=UPI0024A31109|nr:ROK family transcriptional regulator [Actinoplanes regularis]GLW30261.1 transcriptional regulator [Actinoplanes regularis]